jgi:hypothetical protein
VAVAHTKNFVADVKKLQTDGHKGQWADKEKSIDDEIRNTWRACGNSKF